MQIRAKASLSEMQLAVPVILQIVTSRFQLSKLAVGAMRKQISFGVIMRKEVLVPTLKMGPCTLP